MPVSFVCFCGNRIKAARKLVGHGGRCPFCGRSLVIPDRIPEATSIHSEILPPLGPDSTDDEIDAHLSRYPLHPADLDGIKLAIKASMSQTTQGY